MLVTLMKEQAVMLLPLLPKLAGFATTQPDTMNGDEYLQQEASYSISDMFTKKKKNARSTTAQNYLLVSTYTIISNYYQMLLVIQFAIYKFL